MTGKGAVTRRELQIAWSLFAVAAAGIDYLTYGAVYYALKAVGVFT